MAVWGSLSAVPVVHHRIHPLRISHKRNFRLDYLLRTYFFERYNLIEPSSLRCFPKSMGLYPNRSPKSNLEAAHSEVSKTLFPTKVIFGFTKSKHDLANVSQSVNVNRIVPKTTHPNQMRGGYRHQSKEPSAIPIPNQTESSRIESNSVCSAGTRVLFRKVCGDCKRRLWLSVSLFLPSRAGALVQTVWAWHKTTNTFATPRHGWVKLTTTACPYFIGDSKFVR